MPNKKKAIDPIPDGFATEEEVAEFWDTDSLADYEELLAAAEGMAFEIKKRTYEARKERLL